MLRKIGTTLSFALLLVLLLAASVAAQTTSADDEETDAPSVEPLVASLAQAVPVTLTVNLPSPTGTITVELPIFLVLDIRIGIGDSITAAVAVTPSQVFSEAQPVTRTPARTTPAADASPTPTALATRATAGATLTPTPLAATEAPAAEEPAEEPAEEVEPTPTPPSPPTATPILETPTAEPTPTAEVAEVLPPVCADPRAQIIAPGVNQVVSGTINILGTAMHENFQYYKVEYAAGAGVSPDDNFAYLADARVPVEGGVLTSFDTTQLTNGAYTLKLTVVDTTGNFPPPCTVSVVVQN